MNRTWTLVVYLLLVPCSTSHAFQFYSLGDLAGGDFLSEANAISADGSTVVGFSKVSFTDGLTSFNNVDQAFRWTLDTGMIALGDLAGGTFDSRANGVSGDGSVIVGNGNSASGEEAFRWTAAGGLTGIGDLDGGAFYSQANDVSADGSRIVGVSESGNGLEAFQYTGGSPTGLGDLPGDTFRSTANAISDSGLLIVGRSDSALSDPGQGTGLPLDEAFRFPIFSGSLTGLGTLGESAFLPGEGSSATAVSSDGSVVVGWTTTNSLLFTAFRWTAAAGWKR